MVFGSSCSLESLESKRHNGELNGYLDGQKRTCFVCADGVECVGLLREHERSAQYAAFAVIEPRLAWFQLETVLQKRVRRKRGGGEMLTMTSFGIT